MKPYTRNDRARLLRAAKEIARQLQFQATGARIRVRVPYRTSKPLTDGWRAIVGNLGRKRPKLEVWLDRFSGYPDRRFWFGFFSSSRPSVVSITKRVRRSLYPIRVITTDDTKNEKFFALRQRLRRSEFNAPLLEKYDDETFFGVYDRTSTVSPRTDAQLCERAVSFFEEVARALPGAQEQESQSDVYPRCENRKWVRSHLSRERSGLLASQCKERDGYLCKVCGMDFAKVYGLRLGSSFAEAHHLVPLGKRGSRIKTELKDLITVCANCHRMLHRMDGEAGDWRRLKRLVKRHR